MEDFNFDVSQYTVNEMEHLLKLKPKYLLGDIEKYKDVKIEHIIQTNYCSTFKTKLVHFMNEITSILRHNYNKYKEEINNEIYNPMYKNTDYNVTYPTKIVESNLNQLKVQTITKTLSLNTLFRNNNLKIASTSTDCEFILPLKISNVISLKLSSLEFPCSYYTFSDHLKNNVLQITENVTNLSANIVLPEGNYSSGDDFADGLMNSINTGLNSNSRFNVSFDEIKGKITISNITNTFTMNLLTTPNMKLHVTLGWIMGFRNNTYSGLLSYTGETILSLTQIEYIYFYLNDYHVSNRNSVIAIFNENFLDTNILAKIPINVDNFNYLISDNSDFISKERNFFGPVDIEKIHIKIYNKYGEILFINNMDFAFSIECKILYDL
jgi:hypothetical protein